LLFGQGGNVDWHAAVVGSTDLVALPVEPARFIDAHPGFDGAAGNRVALHTECRDEEAVDDVAAGDEDTDVFVYRQDERVIGDEESRLPRFQLVVRNDVA
jgi:hypothetical protein